MRGIHAPRSPIKSPDINKTSLDCRKQWTCPDKLFCPAASYGPCEITGLSYIWSENNIRAQVKEDNKLSMPDCQRLLVKKYALTKKKTNVRARLTLLGGASRTLPRHTKKFIWKDVSFENMLQTNKNNVEELQLSASEYVVTVEDLKRSPSCAGDRACSSRKLKRKDDYEKALICLPKIMPQSQQLPQKNASFSRRSAKMEECDEPWSLTPWVENDSEDEEEVTCIAEQKKREMKKYESFQASARQSVRLPKIGPPKQSHLPKSRYSTEQLKSSVLPFPLLGEKTWFWQKITTFSEEKVKSAEEDVHCRMYNADLFIEVLFHIFCDIHELLFDLTDISALFCDIALNAQKIGV